MIQMRFNNLVEILKKFTLCAPVTFVTFVVSVF